MEDEGKTTQISPSQKKKNTDHELVIQILCLFVMGGTAMTFCLSTERDNSLWTPIKESKALEIK